MTMTPAIAPAPYRAPIRTTSLGALTVFLPLFVVLIWWAFAYRVAPLDGAGMRAAGTVPGALAVLAAVLVAGGSSVISAVILANTARLHALFRPRGSKLLTALVMALLTPVALAGWWPQLFGLAAWSDGLFRALVLLVVLTLAWYSGTTILVSGIRHKVLRALAFALLLWQIWAIIVLAQGYGAA